MNSEPANMASEALLQHADLVRRLVRALVRDEAAVDDIAQDTWVAALEHPPSKPESLGSWLGSVSRRFALRRMRGEERRARRERAVARPEVGDQAGSGHARDLLLENVTRAVLELEEPYKTTVMLRFYEGLGPTQIAQRTGAPLSTVASRLRRGLDRIRKRLDQTTDGGREAWSASASSLAAAQGLLLMGSKLKFVAGALALGLGALVIWKGMSHGPSPEPRGAAGLEQPQMALQRPEPILPDEDPAQAESTERVIVAQAVPAVEEPAPTTGALVLHVTWKHTGSPAVARVFEFFPWDGFEPFAERFSRTSDDRGEILVDGLPAGSVMIYGRLGGGGRVEIVAGETIEEQLLVEQGMSVTGQVLAPDGTSVAGARIWLSDEMNRSDGQILAESGADGAFTIEGVGPSRHIAAFAEGFAPALPRRLEGLPGEAVDVRLELGESGGTVRGLVLDEEGRAIPGARVRVESLQRSMVQRPDGTWVRPFAPWEQACDLAGRFELAGIPLEPVELMVRAPGYAPVLRAIEPEYEGTNERFVLQASGVVFGVLRDEQGEPVAGASIGEGSYGDFVASFGRSKSDGTFRLAHLPVGPIELLAEHSAHGRVRGEFVLEPGVPVEWNGTLAAGSVLAGFVVDGEGAPRTDFIVDAIGSVADPETRTLWSEQMRTDDEGGFRFASCPDEKVQIDVHAPGYVKVETLRDVVPGGEPLTIVIREESLPSARLLGRVVGSDEEPLSATVSLRGPRGPGGYQSGRCDAGSGDFEIGPLPPGVYTLQLKPDDLPALPQREVELLRGDMLDLGTWQLGQVSRIELEVVGHEGLGPFEEVMLFRNGGGGVWIEPRRYMREEMDELVAWPGEYILRARGSEVCSTTVELTVREGEASHVLLKPEAGVPCTLVAVPGALVLPSRVTVSIVDEKDESAASWSELKPDAGELSFTRRLRPGEYTAVVNGREGELARVPFRVPEGDAVTLDLPLD